MAICHELIFTWSYRRGYFGYGVTEKNRRNFQKRPKEVQEWQGFYSTPQVARLTRIPLRTLYNWKQRGIIKPSVQIVEDNRIVEDGYSYADLTIIRMLRALREDRLDLRSAAIALQHLFKRLDPPGRGWADTNVYFVGNKVYAQKADEWDTTAATQRGQKVETRLFGDLFEELKGQEEEGSIVISKEFREFVEINPKVMGGQPVVRCTRIPTSMLAILKRRGKSVDEIVRLYQPIPRQIIEKVLEYEQSLDRRAA